MENFVLQSRSFRANISVKCENLRVCTKFWQKNQFHIWVTHREQSGQCACANSNIYIFAKMEKNHSFSPFVNPSTL
jgi:hypothetical protein